MNNENAQGETAQQHRTPLGIRGLPRSLGQSAGAQERLAPILMTATTTALALLPLAVIGQIPGNEIEHPMALVILGGLVTSTLLNLFVVPPLYLRFARVRSRDGGTLQHG